MGSFLERVAVEPRYMKSTVAQSVRSRPPSGAAAAMGATSADKATVGKVTKELSSQKGMGFFGVDAEEVFYYIQMLINRARKSLWRLRRPRALIRQQRAK